MSKTVQELVFVLKASDLKKITDAAGDKLIGLNLSLSIDDMSKICIKVSGITQPTSQLKTASLTDTVSYDAVPNPPGSL